MAERKFRISEEQKQQLINAIVTLLTVLVSIALTLATQAVSDWIDRPDPVDAGDAETGGQGVFAPGLMLLGDSRGEACLAPTGSVDSGVPAWKGRGPMKLAG